MSNKQQIIDWLEQNDISNYTLVPDQKYGYVINVEGDVYLWGKNLTSIPYKFGKVTGRFHCSYNNLTSLENSPDEVKAFNCSGNKNLQTLEGGPKIVYERYDCSRCDLRTLKGAPIKVNNFFCPHNYNLTSLEHGPKIVEEIYGCSHCNLLTLKGAPIQAEIFDCSYNKNLSSLDYAPRYVKTFDCSETNTTYLRSNLIVTYSFYASNTHIKDLLGCPQNCKLYIFYNCSLISLDGLPKHGNYKICLEKSLEMVSISNIIKNLMQLEKPIILVYYTKENYYNDILHKLPPEARKKIKKHIISYKK